MGIGRGGICGITITGGGSGRGATGCTGIGFIAGPLTGIGCGPVTKGVTGRDGMIGCDGE